MNIIRLTPSGRGAVGSFLLCGEGALDAFLPHWQGKKPVEGHSVWGRLLLAGSGGYEEAVVCRTGDNALEIHIHGGEQIASAIETLFLQQGAVKKTWQEHFTPDTTQRDLALRLLPFAPTERTAQILLDQYNGASEHDPSARERFSELGKHLVKPFRVVLAGASNAGKSSLLNAILGFQRSLVHPVAGTTRDVVGGQTALEGFPVTFFDTAGFRETRDDLERQGIDRSLRSLSDADLVIWVVDLAVGESQHPPCPAEKNMLICHNKIDLVPSHLAGTPALATSALTGEGIETLLSEVIRRLVPIQPMPGEGVYVQE